MSFFRTLILVLGIVSLRLEIYTEIIVESDVEWTDLVIQSGEDKEVYGLNTIQTENVHIEAGADVKFNSPSIKIKKPFSIALGGTFSIKPSAKLINLGNDFVVSQGEVRALDPQIIGYDIVSYNWSATPSQSVIISDSSNQSPSLTFLETGDVTLTLSLETTEGTVEDSVVVTVSDQLPKLVEVGSDLAVYVNMPLALQATTEIQVPKNWHWSTISGPGLVSFADPYDFQTEVTFDTAGTYILQFEVENETYKGIDQLEVVVSERQKLYVALDGDDANQGDVPEGALATLQQAIDQAVEGDEILLAPGIYSGLGFVNLNLNGKNLIIRAEDPNDRPIIDANYLGRHFIFENQETHQTLLKDLILIHGKASSDDRMGLGGSIYIDVASPKLHNLMFLGNEALHGGAVSIVEGNAELQNSLIIGNKANLVDGQLGRAGGLLIAGHAHPDLYHLSIAENIGQVDFDLSQILVDQSAPKILNTIWPDLGHYHRSPTRPPWHVDYSISLGGELDGDHNVMISSQHEVFIHIPLQTTVGSSEWNSVSHRLKLILNRPDFEQQNLVGQIVFLGNSGLSHYIVDQGLEGGSAWIEIAGQTVDPIPQGAQVIFQTAQLKFDSLAIDQAGSGGLESDLYHNSGYDEPFVDDHFSAANPARDIGAIEFVPTSQAISGLYQQLQLYGHPDQDILVRVLNDQQVEINAFRLTRGEEIDLNLQVGRYFIEFEINGYSETHEIALDEAIRHRLAFSSAEISVSLDNHERIEVGLELIPSFNERKVYVNEDVEQITVGESALTWMDHNGNQVFDYEKRREGTLKEFYIYEDLQVGFAFDLQDQYIDEHNHLQLNLYFENESATLDSFPISTYKRYDMTLRTMPYTKEEHWFIEENSRLISQNGTLQSTEYQGDRIWEPNVPSSAQLKHWNSFLFWNVQDLPDLSVDSLVDESLSLWVEVHYEDQSESNLVAEIDTTLRFEIVVETLPYEKKQSAYALEGEAIHLAEDNLEITYLDSQTRQIELDDVQDPNASLSWLSPDVTLSASVADENLLVLMQRVYELDSEFISIELDTHERYGVTFNHLPLEVEGPYYFDETTTIELMEGFWRINGQAWTAFPEFPSWEFVNIQPYNSLVLNASNIDETNLTEFIINYKSNADLISTLVDSHIRYDVHLKTKDRTDFDQHIYVLENQTLDFQEREIHLNDDQGLIETISIDLKENKTWIGFALFDDAPQNDFQWQALASHNIADRQLPVTIWVEDHSELLSAWVDSHKHYQLEVFHLGERATSPYYSEEHIVVENSILTFEDFAVSVEEFDQTFQIQLQQTDVVDSLGYHLKGLEWSSPLVVIPTDTLLDLQTETLQVYHRIYYPEGDAAISPNLVLDTHKRFVYDLQASTLEGNRAESQIDLAWRQDVSDERIRTKLEHFIFRAEGEESFDQWDELYAYLETNPENEVQVGDRVSRNDFSYDLVFRGQIQNIDTKTLQNVVDQKRSRGQDLHYRLFSVLSDEIEPTVVFSEDKVHMVLQPTENEGDFVFDNQAPPKAELLFTAGEDKFWLNWSYSEDELDIASQLLRIEQNGESEEIPLDSLIRNHLLTEFKSAPLKIGEQYQVSIISIDDQTLSTTSDPLTIELQLGSLAIPIISELTSHAGHGKALLTWKYDSDLDPNVIGFLVHEQNQSNEILLDSIPVEEGLYQYAYLHESPAQTEVTLKVTPIDRLNRKGKPLVEQIQLLANDVAHPGLGILNLILSNHNIIPVLQKVNRDEIQPKLSDENRAILSKTSVEDLQGQLNLVIESDDNEDHFYQFELAPFNSATIKIDCQIETGYLGNEGLTIFKSQPLDILENSQGQESFDLTIFQDHLTLGNYRADFFHGQTDHTYILSYNKGEWELNIDGKDVFLAQMENIEHELTPQNAFVAIGASSEKESNVTFYQFQVMPNYHSGFDPTIDGRYLDQRPDITNVSADLSTQGISVITWDSNQYYGYLKLLVDDQLDVHEYYVPAHLEELTISTPQAVPNKVEVRGVNTWGRGSESSYLNYIPEPISSEFVNHFSYNPQLEIQALISPKPVAIGSGIIFNEDDNSILKTLISPASIWAIKLDMALLPKSDTDWSLPTYHNPIKLHFSKGSSELKIYPNRLSFNGNSEDYAFGTKLSELKLFDQGGVLNVVQDGSWVTSFRHDLGDLQSYEIQSTAQDARFYLESWEDVQGAIEVAGWSQTTLPQILSLEEIWNQNELALIEDPDALILQIPTVHSDVDIIELRSRYSGFGPWSDQEKKAYFATQKYDALSSAMLAGSIVELEHSNFTTHEHYMLGIFPLRQDGVYIDSDARTVYRWRDLHTTANSEELLIPGSPIVAENWVGIPEDETVFNGEFITWTDEATQSIEYLNSSLTSVSIKGLMRYNEFVKSPLKLKVKLSNHEEVEFHFSAYDKFSIDADTPKVTTAESSEWWPFEFFISKASETEAQFNLNWNGQFMSHIISLTESQDSLGHIIFERYNPNEGTENPDFNQSSFDLAFLSFYKNGNQEDYPQTDWASSVPWLSTGTLSFDFDQNSAFWTIIHQGSDELLTETRATPETFYLKFEFRLRGEENEFELNHQGQKYILPIDDYDRYFWVFSGNPKGVWFHDILERTKTKLVPEGQSENEGWAFRTEDPEAYMFLNPQERIDGKSEVARSWGYLSMMAAPFKRAAEAQSWSFMNTGFGLDFNSIEWYFDVEQKRISFTHDVRYGNILPDAINIGNSPSTVFENPIQVTYEPDKYAINQYTRAGDFLNGEFLELSEEVPDLETTLEPALFTYIPGQNQIDLSWQQAVNTTYDVFLEDGGGEVILEHLDLNTNTLNIPIPVGYEYSDLQARIIAREVGKLRSRYLVIPVSGYDNFSVELSNAKPALSMEVSDRLVELKLKNQPEDLMGYLLHIQAFDQTTPYINKVILKMGKGNLDYLDHLSHLNITEEQLWFVHPDQGDGNKPWEVRIRDLENQNDEIALNYLTLDPFDDPSPNISESAQPNLGSNDPGDGVYPFENTNTITEVFQIFNQAPVWSETDAFTVRTFEGEQLDDLLSTEPELDLINPEGGRDVYVLKSEHQLLNLTGSLGIDRSLMSVDLEFTSESSQVVTYPIGQLTLEEINQAELGVAAPFRWDQVQQKIFVEIDEQIDVTNFTEEGFHRIEVVMSDADGEVTRHLLGYFLKDLQGPIVDLIAPQHESLTPEGAVALTFNVSDQSGVADVIVLVDGIEVELLDGGIRAGLAWFELPEFNAGQYSLEVSVVDYAGNSTDLAPIELNVYDQGPAIALDLTHNEVDDSINLAAQLTNLSLTTWPKLKSLKVFVNNKVYLYETEASLNEVIQPDGSFTLVGSEAEEYNFALYEAQVELEENSNELIQISNTADLKLNYSVPFLKKWTPGKQPLVIDFENLGYGTYYSYIKNPEQLTFEWYDFSPGVDYQFYRVHFIETYNNLSEPPEFVEYSPDYYLDLYEDYLDSEEEYEFFEDWLFYEEFFDSTLFYQDISKEFSMFNGVLRYTGEKFYMLEYQGWFRIEVREIGATETQVVYVPYSLIEDWEPSIVDVEVAGILLGQVNEVSVPYENVQELQSVTFQGEPMSYEIREGEVVVNVIPSQKNLNGESLTFNFSSGQSIETASYLIVDEDLDFDGRPDSYDPKLLSSFQPDSDFDHQLDSSFINQLLVSRDLDGDGILDHNDHDIDGDGIPNSIDPEPYNAESDYNHDGIADETDPLDDLDGDGILNQDDDDDDNDNIPDLLDSNPFDNGGMSLGVAGWVLNSPLPVGAGGQNSAEGGFSQSIIALKGVAPAGAIRIEASSSNGVEYGALKWQGSHHEFRFNDIKLEPGDNQIDLKLVILNDQEDEETHTQTLSYVLDREGPEIKFEFENKSKEKLSGYLSLFEELFALNGTKKSNFNLFGTINDDSEIDESTFVVKVDNQIVLEAGSGTFDLKGENSNFAFKMLPHKVINLYELTNTFDQSILDESEILYSPHTITISVDDVLGNTGEVTVPFYFDRGDLMRVEINRNTPTIDYTKTRTCNPKVYIPSSFKTLYEKENLFYESPGIIDVPEEPLVFLEQEKVLTFCEEAELLPYRRLGAGYTRYYWVESPLDDDGEIFKYLYTGGAIERLNNYGKPINYLVESYEREVEQTYADEIFTARTVSFGIDEEYNDTDINSKGYFKDKLRTEELNEYVYSNLGSVPESDPPDGGGSGGGNGGGNNGGGGSGGGGGGGGSGGGGGIYGSVGGPDPYGGNRGVSTYDPNNPNPDDGSTGDDDEEEEEPEEETTTYYATPNLKIALINTPVTYNVKKKDPTLKGIYNDIYKGDSEVQVVEEENGSKYFLGIKPTFYNFLEDNIPVGHAQLVRETEAFLIVNGMQMPNGSLTTYAHRVSDARPSVFVDPSRLTIENKTLNLGVFLSDPILFASGHKIEDAPKLFMNGEEIPIHQYSNDEYSNNKVVVNIEKTIARPGSMSIVFQVVNKLNLSNKIVFDIEIGDLDNSSETDNDWFIKSSNLRTSNTFSTYHQGFEYWLQDGERDDSAFDIDAMVSQTATVKRKQTINPFIDDIYIVSSSLENPIDDTHISDYPVVVTNPGDVATITFEGLSGTSAQPQEIQIIPLGLGIQLSTSGEFDINTQLPINSEFNAYAFTQRYGQGFQLELYDKEGSAIYVGALGTSVTDEVVYDSVLYNHLVSNSLTLVQNLEEEYGLINSNELNVAPGMYILVRHNDFVSGAIIGGPTELTYEYESPIGLTPGFTVDVPMKNHSSQVTVYHHNKKPVIDAIDFTFPGKHFGLGFARTFRETKSTGPLGNNWTHTFMEHFRTNLDKSEFFYQSSDGQWIDCSEFLVPDAFFFKLEFEDVELKERIVLTLTNGTKKYFFHDSVRQVYQLDYIENVYGHQVRFFYDKNSKLTKILYPGHREIKFFYEEIQASTSRLKRIETINQHKVEYTYNEQGDLTEASLTGPEGGMFSMKYVYDEFGQLKQVLRDGNVVWVDITRSGEDVSTLSYGKPGEQLSVGWSSSDFTDENSITTSYSFGDDALPSSKTISAGPLSIVESYSYDQSRIHTVTTSTGKVITTSYNRSGAGTEDNRAGELVTEVERSGGGLSESSRTTYFGEEFHYAMSGSSDDTGLSVTYTSNDKGEMTSRTIAGAGGVNETYTYEDGLLETVNHSDGRTVEYTYYSEELAWTVDQDSSLEGQLYSVTTTHADGTVSKVTTPKNIYGRTLSSISPRGATTSYTSSGWGPVERIAEPPLLEGDAESISSTEYGLSAEGWINSITRKVAVPDTENLSLSNVNYNHATETVSRTLDGIGRVTTTQRTKNGEQLSTSSEYTGTLLTSSGHEDGTFTNYRYDAVARLVKVVSGVESSTTDSVGDAGWVEGSRIERNEYNTQNQLVNIYETIYPATSETLLTTYTYDGLNRVKTIADHVSNTVTTYTYTNAGRTTQTSVSRGGTVILDHTSESSPDGSGSSIINHLKADKVVYESQYDSQSRTMTETDAENQTRTVVSNGSSSTTTEANGLVRVLGLNVEGDLISEKLGNEPANTIERHLNGAVHSVEDPDLGSTQQLATGYGIPAAVAQNGIIEVRKMDEDGQVNEVTEGLKEGASPDARTTQSVEFVEDRQHVLIRGAQATKTIFDTSGRPTTRTYHYTATSKDTLGPAAATESWTYNDQSQIKTFNNKNGVTFTYHYDAQHRIEKIDADGSDVRRFLNYNEFNLAERLEEVNDGHTVVTMRTYDSEGRLFTETVEGRTVSYTYDDLNRMETIQYPNDEKLTYSYLADNRLNRIYLQEDALAPLELVIDYEYENSSLPLLEKITYGEDGITAAPYAEFDYQSRRLNQIKSMQLINVDLGVSNNGKVYNYEFNNFNQKAKVSQWSNALDRIYSYDDLRRLVGVDDGGLWDNYGDSTLYLDSFENRLNTSEVDGQTYDFTVSQASKNQITSFVYNGQGDLLEDDRYQYQRDVWGRIIKVTNKNAFLTTIDLELTPANTSGLTSTFDYDPLNASDPIEDPMNPTVFPLAMATQTLVFELNSLPQEPFYVNIDGESQTINVSVDDSQTPNVVTLTFVQPCLNSGFDLVYPSDLDPLDIPTSVLARTVYYNEWYQMSYFYDASGRRVIRKLDPISGKFDRKYTYSGMKMIYDGSKNYIYGTEINHVLAENDTTLKHYVIDQRGTVYGKLDGDDSIDEYSYSAWGQTNNINSRHGKFGYTGMYIEPYTELYHTHYREYDWRTGRWDREDPAGYMDGLNLYQAYFDVNGVDPTGLFELVYNEKTNSLSVFPERLIGFDFGGGEVIGKLVGKVKNINDFKGLVALSKKYRKTFGIDTIPYEILKKHENWAIFSQNTDHFSTSLTNEVNNFKAMEELKQLFLDKMKYFAKRRDIKTYKKLAKLYLRLSPSTNPNLLLLVATDAGNHKKAMKAAENTRKTLEFFGVEADNQWGPELSSKFLKALEQAENLSKVVGGIQKSDFDKGQGLTVYLDLLSAVNKIPGGGEYLDILNKGSEKVISIGKRSSAKKIIQKLTDFETTTANKDLILSLIEQLINTIEH